MAAAVVAMDDSSDGSSDRSSPTRRVLFHVSSYKLGVRLPCAFARTRVLESCYIQVCT